MASTEGLVPITRSFLSSYYDKYPFRPLSGDVSRLSTEIRTLAFDLLAASPPSQGEAWLVEEVDRQPPHKVDENMWKNREQLEEIVFLLDKSRWPRSLQEPSTEEESKVAGVLENLRGKFERSWKTLKSFQAKNSEHVFNIVMTYMPQDFRGTIIRQQRERSERNKQAAVDALVSSGCSICEKYALLWKQQVERRQQLAQLGSATGVYKTLVKYLVGVPEVLLDFVRQINDDDGPMEEQRHRYGPPLYCLTTMILLIRLYILLLWGRYEATPLKKHQVTMLEHAADTYTCEFERFITFISDVFANSPFFISAEAAGNMKTDEYKELAIQAGKTHEVSLSVDEVNSYISWDFSLVQGKISMDIGFSVEYTDQSGQTRSGTCMYSIVAQLILPYRRYGSHEGNFCTIMAGNYRLVWDNSYSSFFKKFLRYKVDCIPPVVGPLQSTPEVEE